MCLRYLLTFALLGFPALVYGSAVDRGTWLVSGSANGHFGRDDWPELAETLLTMLILFVDDEDENCYGSDTYDYQHRHYPSAVDDCPGISIPQSQFGFGVGYFVSSHLALGARSVYREDYRTNDIRRLWGTGPELVYFFGGSSDPVRPFLGASLLFTRGTDRKTGARLADGTSFDIRAGVNIPFSDSAGFVLQTGYQSDHLPFPGGEPRTGRTVGIGLGLAVFVD